MRFLLFSSLKTRRLFCSVCLSALFFTWLPESKAQQLTAADIQAAFVDALKEYAEYSSGEDWGLVTIPMGDDVFFLKQYLIARPDGLENPNTSGIGYVFLEHMQALFPMIRAILNSNTNSLSLLHPGRVDSDAILVEDSAVALRLQDIALDAYTAANVLNSLDRNINFVNGRLQVDAPFPTNFLFDSESALYVDDTGVRSKLDEISLAIDELISYISYNGDFYGIALVNDIGALTEVVEGIADDVSDSLLSLQSIEGYAADIPSLVENSHTQADWIRSQIAADDEADETLEGSIAEAEGAQAAADQAAADDYAEIPLPTATDSYSPDLSGMTDEDTSFTDVGLGNQTVGDHNALIRLYSRPSGNRSASDYHVLPDVEIDWGRDQALSSAASDFGTFFGWLWPIFGTLFLTAKGVVMFRKCKLASEATAILGSPQPLVSLAWDPF